MTLPEITPERAFVTRLEALLGYRLSIKNDMEILHIIESVNTQGFKRDKLEKDFYLTAILHHLSKVMPEITFKGGTCLNKLYYPYFRLSEDLDFMMCSADPLVNSNGKRQAFAYKIREAMYNIATTLGWTLNAEHLQHKKAQGNKNLKKKEYTYLKYLLTYPSLFDGTKQYIKIEVTYTEKQHFSEQYKPIHAIFVDEILNDPIFPEQTIRCLALEEMMSEKIRACLSRRVPAIRDFFDVRYVRQQGVNLSDLKPVIVEKLAETESVCTIDGRFDVLQKQVETDLKPMLGTRNLSFDLKEIYDYILSIQASIVY